MDSALNNKKNLKIGFRIYANLDILNNFIIITLGDHSSLFPLRACDCVLSAVSIPLDISGLFYEKG